MLSFTTLSPRARGCASIGLATVSALALYKISKRVLTEKVKSLSPAPDGRLRTILITGGASGIGLRTAVKFLLEGWRVGVYDLNIEGIEQKLSDIEPLLKSMLKDNLIYKKFDVTDEASCQEAIQHFLSQTDGKLDCLFNCAGLLYVGPFEKETWAKQRKMIRVNVEGLVQMTHVCLDALKKTPGSCIVSMASVSAVGGVPNFAIYSATKSFVYYFTESLRSELFHPHQIRTCDVSVSFVDTPMVQSQLKENQPDSMKAQAQDVKPYQVANTIFEAVHKSSYYNVHFYVRGVETRAFFSNFLMRALWPSLVTRITDSMLQLDFQKKK